MDDFHRILHDCWISQNKIEKFFKKKASLFIHYGFLLALCVGIHLFGERINFGKIDMRILLAQSFIEFHYSTQMNLHQLPLTNLKPFFMKTHHCQIFDPQRGSKPGQIDSIIGQPT